MCLLPESFLPNNHLLLPRRRGKGVVGHASFLQKAQNRVSTWTSISLYCESLTWLPHLSSLYFPGWCSSLTVCLATPPVFLSDILNPCRNETGKKKINVEQGWGGETLPPSKLKTWEERPSVTATGPVAVLGLLQQPWPWACNQGHLLTSRSKEGGRTAVSGRITLCASYFREGVGKGGEKRTMRSSFSG